MVNMGSQDVDQAVLESSMKEQIIEEGEIVDRKEETTNQNIEALQMEKANMEIDI